MLTPTQNVLEGDAAARAYYAIPHVRERIREYCGLAPGAGVRCLFLCAQPPAARGDGDWDRSPRHPPELLETLLDAGASVTRSLWDAENLLFHLDLDYLNVDRPDEAFTHPAEVFFKLEPTYRAITGLLAHFRVRPLAIATGEGYHFTGRVPLDHPVTARLAALVPDTPTWQRTQDTRRPAWLTASVSEEHARAFTGLGLVFEFLAHRILHRAAPTSLIPVVLSGTVVGSGLVGRECVSVDLTQFADPLDVRHLRSAFGIYRKPGIHPDGGGPGPLVALPRGEGDLGAFLLHGRGAERARALARRRRVRIPVVAEGVGRLLDAYLASPLAAFHRAFHAPPAAPGPAPEGAAEGPGEPPRLDPATLPPCVAACLAAPNDLLLKPAHLQNLTRALLARGFSARAIADRVEALYAADHGWGDRWSRLDPRVHAEGFVRAFAGLVHAGVDRLVDFNCVSTREKGMCPGGACAYDLRDDARRLLERSPA